MEKFKGTKGKWMLAICGKNVHGKDKYEVVADVEYHGTMGSSDETPVCAIKQYNTYEQSMADAKLIASAPELLEALQGLIDPLTNLVLDSVAHEIGTEASYMIEQAINKALK